MTYRVKETLYLLSVLLPFAFFPCPVHSQQPVAARLIYDDQGINVVRQERDTNGDGRMDQWTYYNRQGQIERVEQDVNFDGKPDLFAYYEAGKLARQELASKNDGQIDTWLIFDARGELERKGQDLNR